MNLFQQYGIKEVADVTFYSINRVGDEEFYSPVLLLDTLKVSTLEKKQQTADSYGGYGNQKIASWSFSKGITLKLEDALFSPASMSLMWGGQLETNFSNYTSAIVKINIANKYGKLNYSPLAQPSPQLTPEEWDVIYQACDDLNKSFIYKMIPVPFITDSYNKDEPYIEENRVALQKSYYQRNFTEIFNQYAPTANPSQKWEHSIEQDNIAIPDCIVQQLLSSIKKIQDFHSIDTNLYDFEVIDRMEKCIVREREGLVISVSEQKKNLLKYFANDKNSSYVIYYDPKTMLPLLPVDETGTIIGWQEEQEEIIDDTVNTNYDYSAIVSSICDTGKWISSIVKLNTVLYESGHKTNLGLIKEIAQLVTQRLRNEHKIGSEENVVLLWGFDLDGLFRTEIDNQENFEFKDKVKVIHTSEDVTEHISNNFEPGQVMPQKEGEFKLRIGTPYLKWSRTIKENSGINDGILGKTLVINPDTFSGTYKIVGETYIKNRKGKDSRFQFVINEAKIAADTNITLQADGDPTVFSMNIDVFNPPNDIMMELRSYDVIEDNINGGMKILPQKNELVTTQTIIEITPESFIENNEIY